jgi:hypothetical protein
MRVKDNVGKSPSPIRLQQFLYRLAIFARAASRILRS